MRIGGGGYPICEHSPNRGTETVDEGDLAVAFANAHTTGVILPFERDRPGPWADIAVAFANAHATGAIEPV